MYPFLKHFFKNKREFAISFYFHLIKFYFLTLLFLSTFHFSKEEGREGNSNCLFLPFMKFQWYIYHINRFKMVPEFSRTGTNIDWLLIVTVRLYIFSSSLLYLKMSILGPVEGIKGDWLDWHCLEWFLLVAAIWLFF